MIRNLHIENYAIIDFVEIDFSDGFTIITGETGAGKSILLGALSLILGQRAESNVLFNQNKKCIIEGCFDLNETDFKEFFLLNEIDFDAQTIIRREINQQGKSRAFINDTPVNLNVLKDLGEKIVDIHSQHKTLLINDSDFQLAVIDNYVGHAKELAEYRVLYNDYVKQKKKLQEIQSLHTKLAEENDYFNFLFTELDQLNYKIGELEVLEEEQKILSNAEEIKKILFQAHNLLINNDDSLTNRNSELVQVVSSVVKYNAEINDIYQRLKNTLIELKDISGDVEALNEKIIYNPERLTIVNERLDAIYALTQKHKLKSADELENVKSTLSEKINQIDDLDHEIDGINKSIKQLEKLLVEKAKVISKNRVGVKKNVEKELCAVLSSLGMPKIKFEITINTAENFNFDGFDSVKFLIDTNGNNDLHELSKVASGGELSRIMLAIKSLIAKKNLIPTMIFDEIDIGISGDVADKAGNIMQRISVDIQVIAITHLPQIAAKANTHLYVYKEQSKDVNTSKIKHLNKDERIIEIAKMLSGEKVTDAAIENAKELLK